VGVRRFEAMAYRLGLWVLSIAVCLCVCFSQRRCKEHGRAIEYVCQTDGMMICAHCAILGSHRSDLGHQVAPIDNLVSSLSLTVVKMYSTFATAFLTL